MIRRPRNRRALGQLVVLVTLLFLPCCKRTSAVASDASLADGAITSTSPALVSDAAVLGSANVRNETDGAIPRVDAPTLARVPPITIAPDAGMASCRLVGTAMPPGFNGPAALRVRADDAELVFNDVGLPRIVKAVMTATADVHPAASPPPAKSPLPACAVAGDVIYCADADGNVRHGAKIVARARAGTNLAALALGKHVLLAFLAERVTTEGLLREAFVSMDDAPPVRLSEEGSGATFVDLAARPSGGGDHADAGGGSENALALVIDARVAMTPVHARTIRVEGGALRLGADAVIFVAGSAERHNAGTLATARDGRAFVLVPIADDALTFGMAAVRIDDVPRDDSPITWSPYANGLDPAPIAATRDDNVVHVARVRPKSREPSALRVLEIGRLDNEGAFLHACTVTEEPFVKDVKLASDREGLLWIYWRDSRGVHLEHRAPPVGSGRAPGK